MSIRKQDRLVLLFYYLGYSRIRNLIFRLQHKPAAIFVTFHDIIHGASGCFEANLRFLKRYTNVVSLDDFFSNKLSVEKINTVITFDDGYKSWVTEAIPALQELRLPATFFISSGFVGLSPADEAKFIRSNLLLTKHCRTSGGLSFGDVKRIVEKGFNIGGHTLSHCNLSGLLGVDQLRREINEDKLNLERMMGTKIDYFSYPSGAYQNPRINLIDVLKESGYKGAVTTVSGFNSVETNPYLLHRELTGASMPEKVFKSRVYGNYNAVMFITQRIPMIRQR